MPNLPPTRYIEAGPGLPTADPNAAMAPARAYAGMGNTIAQMGQQGMELAAKLREIEDGGKIAELYAEMEKDAADFSIKLMTREDTEAWPAEWKKRAEAWKLEAKKKGLSPGAAAKFEQKFTEWNTRRSIGFETQAATKALEIAKGRIGNALSYHMENADWEAAEYTLQAGAAALGSVETERLRMKIDSERRHNDILADIDDDPAAWLNNNEKPLPGYDMLSWNRVRSHARSVERQRTYEVATNVMDRIVTGEVISSEQIEAEAAALRPTERAKLEKFLGDYQAAEAAKLRNDPDWQAGVLGQFDRMLADYQPASGDEADFPGIELNSLVELMPVGSLKDDMKRRVGVVLANDRARAESVMDLSLAELAVAAKAGMLGRVSKPQEFDTDTAIARGFLTGTEGLQSLGFSAKQAKKIVNPDITDADRLKLFRENWKLRENPDAAGTRWASAAAQAIISRSGTFTVEPEPDPYDLAGQQGDIDLKLGRVRAHMLDWQRLNPVDARDPGKVRAELQRATGMEVRKPAGRLSAPPRREDPAVPATGEIPTETSMNSLPAPLQPLAPVFEQAGRAHGIDPRFLMAISMHETANGRSSAFRNKRNAMGVSNSKGPIAFEDPAESVHRMARVLASPKGPYRNARTLAQIGQVYAPIGAGNDPRSLNKHWTAGVSKYLRQLGGDPNQIFLNA